MDLPIMPKEEFFEIGQRLNPGYTSEQFEKDWAEFNEAPPNGDLSEEP